VEQEEGNLDAVLTAEEILDLKDDRWDVADLDKIPPKY